METETVSVCFRNPGRLTKLPAWYGAVWRLTVTPDLVKITFREIFHSLVYVAASR